MIYTELTIKAMNLAYAAHHGQFDKGGVPYIFHPIHLAEGMDDEISTCVALLHDTVEDTAVTLEQLAQEFPPAVVEAVDLLTHREGVEYFDYYLIHDVRRSHYEIYNNLDCFTWAQEKKAKGLIKHLGFSFHDNAEFLDQVLTEHPEMEFVQLQINYLDWESENVQSRKCYEVACKHGVPVIVMEPVKGGTLANVPKPVEKLFKDYAPEQSVASWAVRFAAGLDNVMMVLSGMSNMEQMLDNTSFMMDLKPLNEEELALIHKAADIIRSGIAIPCTACSYCTDGCPVSIPIPTYFAQYNEYLSERNGDKKKAIMAAYEKTAHASAWASQCIECGQCEGICPQELPIIQHLKRVSEYFE